MSSHHRTRPVEYRPVVGFPDYLVGTDGSLWGRMLRGACVTAKNPKRRPTALLRKDGKTYRRQISRLVLEAFVGPCPPGQMALHEDDDAWHNELSNLYYGTAEQNAADARRNGRMIVGSQQWNAKLTEQKVLRMRKLWRAGWKSRALGKRFKISENVAWKACNYYTWKHVA